MPNSISFFPWIRIDRELSIGSTRLLPYARGKLPGDRQSVSQKEIDAIIAAYSERKDRPIEFATLLELDDWNLGSDASDRLGDLFKGRDLVAFAALTERRLFRGHFDYCNTHNYVLIIQNYDPNNLGRFSFTVRRRDGYAQHFWGTADFAFYRPHHVSGNARAQIDESLLLALQAADKVGRLPHDAIIEFNAANTDSPDTPLHTEMVMTKSALEFLFEIGSNVNDFAREVCAAIPQWEVNSEIAGPLSQTWLEIRKKSPRLLDAWAREFCDMRGSSAHGKERGGTRFVWSTEAHLSFAGILFPLLVKLRLAREGFLQMNEKDEAESQMIEAYLTHDPMAPLLDDGSRREHPWELVYSSGVRREVMRREMEREMRKLDWSQIKD